MKHGRAVEPTADVQVSPENVVGNVVLSRTHKNVVTVERLFPSSAAGRVPAPSLRSESAATRKQIEGSCTFLQIVRRHRHRVQTAAVEKGK
jgi:hypothetical protein